MFQQNNYMNIKIDGKLLELICLICMYQQFLFWRGVAHVYPRCVRVQE